MIARPVSAFVNSPSNDDPRCLELSPVDGAAFAAGTLPLPEGPTPPAIADPDV